MAFDRLFVVCFVGGRLCIVTLKIDCGEVLKTFINDSPAQIARVERRCLKEANRGWFTFVQHSGFVKSNI